jgi:hypothetical protein
MKKLYKSFFIQALFIVLILYSESSNAQCSGGNPGGITAYDTTVRFATGVTTTQIKFPKFNPQTGMLSCVKLIITITGIIDTVAMQNYSASPQTADFYYDRTDAMSGPGLTPPLSNTFNQHYGPYSLTAYDGIPGAGTDFKPLPRDTVLRKVMVRTLTDSTEISQFYGSDSVTYNYNINVTTSAVITGGSSSSLVLTSAYVNFRFEYCTCPITTLPLGLLNFSVAKSGSNGVQLSWTAEGAKEDFIYEIEMSRDGRSFTKTGVVNKKDGAFNLSYQYGYAVKNNEWGKYYFRVKQRWLSNGYSRFTEIKSIDFANPLFSTVSLYPNPSSGIVGIKFVTVKRGKFLVQISNAQGQIIESKEVVVAETDYKVVANLQTGLYYIKLTDVATNTFCIKQMVIK